MSNYKMVGFFLEESTVEEDRLTVSRLMNGLDIDLVQPILKFLEAGSEDAAAAGSFYDVMMDPPQQIAPLIALTDGTWVWPNYLAYYVRQYRVSLPQEFVNYVLNKSRP